MKDALYGLAIGTCWLLIYSKWLIAVPVLIALTASFFTEDP